MSAKSANEFEGAWKLSASKIRELRFSRCCCDGIVKKNKLTVQYYCSVFRRCTEMLKALSSWGMKSSGFTGEPALSLDSFACSARRLRFDSLLICAGILAIFAGWLAVSVIPAHAQIDRGTIEGQVTDQTGAIVIDAKVQIINNATNSAITLATNSQGLYTAPNLPTGTYRVVITKQGFSSATQEQVIVQPSFTLRADFVLQPGQITQSVTVTTEAPLLDVGTTNNSVGMEDNLIEQVPLIVTGTQRAITDYLTSFPGYTGSSSFEPTANGAGMGDTEVFIDGGPASEWGISRGALTEVSPMVEQVGEISVVSNAFNAEYGGFGSWFTNVVLKSGTNELHGSVFDHLGNSALDAKSYFQTSVTPYRQNEGGFTLGGPLVLPKIYNGRNKTFFFASLGLFYSREGAGGGLITVPTQAECQGDFSQSGENIFDPATTTSNGAGGYTRTQFSYNGQLNVIPPSRISQAAKTLCGYIPAPDYTTEQYDNYRSRNASTWPYFDTYTPLIKIDHSFSDKEKLSVSFTDQIRHRILSEDSTAFMNPPAWGEHPKDPLDDYYDQIANSWKVRINVDSVITPAILNHITLSTDRYINLGPNGTDGQGWDTTLGLSGFPDDNGAMPKISFSGDSDAPSTFGASYEEDWHETRYTVDENLSWSHGKHNFKFGFEIGMNQENRFIKPGVAGAFTFTSEMTAQTSTSGDGASFAALMLGAVEQASAYVPLDTGLRFLHYGYFGQDEWHITPKLTISYGLRWDYSPRESAAHNYQTTFETDLTNPDAGNLKGALAYAGNGTGEYGKPFQDNWHKGFAPRLGLAYQLNKRTMVRASSGIYYASTGNLVPFLDTGAEGYSANPSFSSSDAYTPLYYWNAGTFPQNFEKPPAIDPSFANGLAVQWIPRNGDRLPQTLNWVLDVEREVIPNLSLDISYIGSHSTHLPLSGTPTEQNYVTLNQVQSVGFPAIVSACTASSSCTVPFSGFTSQTSNSYAQALKPYPQYTLIDTDAVLLPEGMARYNSLQIKATKRTSYGLSGLAFFTWMKNMTNNAGSAGDTTYASSYGTIEQYPEQNPAVIDSATPAATFGTSWSYDLPFGKGRPFLRKSSTIVNDILGDWTLSGSFHYSSGAALQIDAYNFYWEIFGWGSLAPYKYANYVGGKPHGTWSGKFDANKDLYLNSSAFEAPGTLDLGNTSQYLSWCRGFTQGSEALEFGKTIPLHERLSFDLTADFVNPFNIVRWDDPSTVAGISSFGKVTSIQGSPRTIQINGKIRF
jgi:hypothetical protein